MSLPVRVIGRVDLADQIAAAVRSAGFKADMITAGPVSVYYGTSPAQGVDVVVATSIFDPPLWRIAKAKHPLRPMIALAERRRERALRGAMLRRDGPDAYVTWPATPEDLAAAIRRAESSASRQRSWSAADVGASFLTVGLPLLIWMNVAVGTLVAGVGLLLGLRSAWNLRWQAVSGVFLTVLGGAEVAVQLARWFR